MSWFERFAPPYTPERARRFSPLQLAYVGDSVFDLYVRTHMLLRHDAPSGMLHRRSTGYVSAEAQARAFLRIEPLLTEEERNIARWGRNAHNPHSAKNANRQAYARATGLETLIGFLYLTAQDDRISAILDGIVGEDKGAGDARETGHAVPDASSKAMPIRDASCEPDAEATCPHPTHPQNARHTERNEKPPRPAAAKERDPRDEIPWQVQGSALVAPQSETPPPQREIPPKEVPPCP